MSNVYNQFNIVFVVIMFYMYIQSELTITILSAGGRQQGGKAPPPRS
jgi:hypothetical protein